MNDRQDPPGGDDSVVDRLAPALVSDVWSRLRESFWLLPSAALLAAVVAGVLLVGYDGGFDLWTVPGLGWTHTTPSAARAVLSTIVGALITVTGVTFSVMMLVLSQTASQLGPRVVRTVVSGNELQATLASLLATVGFNLISLQSIREAHEAAESGGEGLEAFVPETAVAAGLLAFFAALGVLVYFVNHVSRIIRVPDLLHRLAAELDESVDANRPDGPHPPAAVEAPRGEAGVETEIRPPADGYLQAVNVADLVEAAEQADAVIRMLVPIGAFVRRDAPVAVATGGSRLDGEPLETAEGAIAVGDERTPRQDIESPVLEIAEIAVRALSPGVNDPRTACMCLDRLTAGLCRAVRRPPPPSEFRGDDGAVRVRRPCRSTADLLESAFSQIAFYAAADPTVIEGVSLALETVHAACVSPDERRAVAAAAGRSLDRFRLQTNREETHETAFDRLRRVQEASG